MHIARGSAHASPRAGCARDFTTFSINLTFLRGGLLVAKLLVQVFAMCIRDRLISAFIPTAGAAAAAATVAAAGAAAALGLHFIDALFFSPLAPQAAVVVLPRCSSSLIYTSHRQRGSFSFSPPASPSSSYTFISLQLARLSFRRLLFLILSLLSLSLACAHFLQSCARFFPFRVHARYFLRRRGKPCAEALVLWQHRHHSFAHVKSASFHAINRSPLRRLFATVLSFGINNYIFYTVVHGSIRFVKHLKVIIK